MGSKGPIPKRSEERRRRNTTDSEGKPNEAEQVVVDAPPVSPLPVPEHWHADAKELYQAVVDSAFARFYEPSDWAALKFSCEVMSRLLKPQPIKVATADGGEEIQMEKMPVKGADLNALNRIWGSLLLLEGDRRRLQIEIKREADKPKLPATAEQVVANRAALFSVTGGKG